MKRTCSTIVLLLLFLAAFAQPPQRFIEYYQPASGLGGESYGVAETSYGYMLSGLSTDTSNGNFFHVYKVMGIDWMGNLLWEKSYGNPGITLYSGWFLNEWLKKDAGRFYSVYGFDEGDNNPSAKLICMDELGDTLWTNEFHGDSIDSILSPYSVSRCSNGDFLIGGRTFSYGNGSKMFILRADSTGNFIWKKKYNVQPNYVEEIRNVIEDPITKRYVILAGNGNPQKGILYIADTTGAMIHQQVLSGTFGGVLTCLKRLSGGDYVAGGVQENQNSGGSYYYKAHLVRFGPTGNIVWSKEYGEKETISNEFAAVQVLAGDTILAAGQYDTIHPFGINSMFRVQKIDPAGNLVWSRYIDLTKNTQNFDMLKSMTLTSDGGVALTGCFPTNSAPTPFVLVKLDSYGCDTAACQTVSVKNIEQAELSLQIYPNPAKDVLQVTGTSTLDGNINITVYNRVGQLVLSAGGTEIPGSVDISSLNPGLYFLRLIQDDHVKNIPFQVIR